MRVALTNPTYWPEVRRGSERVLHELAIGLRDGGDRPRILTSHPGLRSRAIEEGIEVVRLPRVGSSVLRLRRFQEHLEHLPFLYAALRAGDDELAQTFFPTDALAAQRWDGGPAVFSYMGIPRRDVLASLRLRLKVLEGAVVRSDAVVALSGAARNAIWRWFGVEARVVHPGVDLAAFPLQNGRDPAPTICCAGSSDDRRKRVPLLVRALSLVRRSRPDARLLLMRPGDPRLEEALRAEGVELMDLTSEQVVQMYGRAWISVLPSYNEAFGLVLVEGMACGRPAVTGRDGAGPEIIDRPEVGRLFEGDEPEPLARALLEALEVAEDPGTPAACRERAAAFSTGNATERYRALYRELLA
jgi:glycosyltransferase involved in cell wall biosynthesis